MTLAQARKLHPLAPAVLRQLSGHDDVVQSAIDAANHGADGGFNGFTYYRDTCGFTRRNRKAIAAAVEAMADDLGEQPIPFVRSFRCLEDYTTDNAIAAALYGGRSNDVEATAVVENALAWFALEEVGRAIADAAE